METRYEFAALADDLTGALEAGAFFAGAGIGCLVSVGGELPGVSTGVLVFDTETRHLPPADAARKVGDLARAAALAGSRGIYKKTDSTLRGPIGAELKALQEAWPGVPLTYIPAYPRMGRTVRNGRLYVNGVPLEETSFARDPVNPALTGDLHTLLSESPGPAPVAIAGAAQLDAHLARDRGSTLFVCDSETDADLEALVAVLVRREALSLTAGTAALAALLARVLPLSRSAAASPIPRAARGLVACGSLHPASIEQMETAGSVPGWTLLRGHPETLSAAVPGKLAGCEALVVFGGDTAYAILKALGVDAIEPLRELLPGIPVSRIRAGGRELTLVTKAGGFGPPDVVRRIRGALAG
jgi:D-threonate/D-erythronate kinase